jgi:hypothetical protein
MAAARAGQLRRAYPRFSESQVHGETAFFDTLVNDMLGDIRELYVDPTQPMFGDVRAQEWHAIRAAQHVLDARATPPPSPRTAAP